MESICHTDTDRLDNTHGYTDADQHANPKLDSHSYSDPDRYSNADTHCD